MMNTLYGNTNSAKISSTILDTYGGRTILVTGGRGYIGSALTQLLAHVNCKLILLDQAHGNAWMTDGQTAEVSLLNGDISDRKMWDKVLPGIDFVFHLAAREYFYRHELNPEMDLSANALPVLYLLESCRINNHRPKIVFASSANLFGSAGHLPVNEDFSDDPLTIWAIHKLTAEHYLQFYAREFGIHSISLRLANVYGPTPNRSVMTRVVLNKVIAQALRGDTIKTYSNQDCIRDYVFLEDVIQAFLLAGAHCGQMERPFYVIGSGERKSIADVWCLIAERVMSQTHVNVPIQLDKSVEIERLESRNFVADTECYHAATGWKPRIELTEGIDRTICAFLSEPRRNR